VGAYVARLPVAPVVALVVVQFSFATLAVAGKEALLLGLPPLALAGLRVFFASLLLAALALARPAPALTGPDWARLAGLSLLGVVLNQLLFIEGLARSTAVNASILIATIPVFTLLAAVLLRRERTNLRRTAGVLVALVGTLALLHVERFSLDHGTAVGNLLIVGNCLAYSFYLVLSRNLLQRYPSPLIVAWTFLFGALVLFPLGVPDVAVAASAGILTPRLGWVLAWIVLVPSVVSYGLNNYALKRVRASTVASFVFLQPLFGVVLALWWLPNESLEPRSMLAAAAILAGVALVVRSEQPEPSSP
jgi:drug/metabolite transporter (DMT)-like permease